MRFFEIDVSEVVMSMQILTKLGSMPYFDPSLLLLEASSVADTKSGWSGFEITLLVLMFVTVLLAGTAAALALLAYRFNKLRFAKTKEGGNLVSFDDVACTWMSDLQNTWKSSSKRQEEALGWFKKRTEEVNGNINNLNLSFDRHLGDLLAQIKEAKEYSKALQAEIDGKNAEIAEYREGFKISLTREPLEFLCEARDHLQEVVRMHKSLESGSEPSGVEKALLRLDALLSNRISICGLNEIKVLPGDAIDNNSELSGRFTIVGTIETDAPEIHKTVKEVVKPGYTFIVPRVGAENHEELFRPVILEVYACQSRQAD